MLFDYSRIIPGLGKYRVPDKEVEMQCGASVFRSLSFGCSHNEAALWTIGFHCQPLQIAFDVLAGSVHAYERLPPEIAGKRVNTSVDNTYAGLSLAGKWSAAEYCVVLVSFAL